MPSLLVSTMGMMVMANTTDLVVMFLGLEVMSVPLYVMAAFNRRSLESNEAGIKYFIMGAFATSFLLHGYCLCLWSLGLYRPSANRHRFQLYLGRQRHVSLCGYRPDSDRLRFQVSGTVPFHTWIPDVYHGAPTPVTAFFSVAPKAAGFAVLLRIFMYGFADAQMLGQAFWVLSVLTMSVGNILALRQNNVKRMLAYSSIAHAGYILVALTVGTQDAVSSAVFYLVAYMLFNLGAFGVLTILETRAGCKSEFSELSGLAISIALISRPSLRSLCLRCPGFPPTVGFFGKFYVFRAAVENGFIWLAVIGVMNSFVSVYYYLRVVKTCYFDEEVTVSAQTVLPASVAVVLIVTAIGTLGFGLFPGRTAQSHATGYFRLPVNNSVNMNYA